MIYFQRNFRLCLFLTACIAVCSCTNENTQGKIHEYYDLEGLLHQQLLLLSALKPTLDKKVEMGEKTENSSSIPDSLLWARELTFFFEGDINKPMLLGAYDKLENGNVIEYKVNTEISGGRVESLKLTFEPDKKVLRQIEIDYQESNPVFASRKKLSMSLSAETARIESYSIEGMHKIVFKDTLRYSINGTVLY